MIKSIINWVFIVCIVMLLVNIGKSLSNLNRASLRLDEAEIKVETLEEQRQKLIENNTARKTGSYFEKQIRDNLKMVMEGEVLVILPEELKEENMDEGFRYIVSEQGVKKEDEIVRMWIDIFF